MWFLSGLEAAGGLNPAVAALRDFHVTAESNSVESE